MQALNPRAARLQSAVAVPLPLEKKYHRCVSVGRHSASRGVSCPQPAGVTDPFSVLARPLPHTAPPTVAHGPGMPLNGLL